MIVLKSNVLVVNPSRSNGNNYKGASTYYVITGGGRGEMITYDKFQGEEGLEMGHHTNIFDLI